MYENSMLWGILSWHTIIENLKQYLMIMGLNFNWKCALNYIYRIGIENQQTQLFLYHFWFIPHKNEDKLFDGFPC
jgi:hypothetical protein